MEITLKPKNIIVVAATVDHGLMEGVMSGVVQFMNVVRLRWDGGYYVVAHDCWVCVRSTIWW